VWLHIEAVVSMSPLGSLSIAVEGLPISFIPAFYLPSEEHYLAHVTV